MTASCYSTNRDFNRVRGLSLENCAMIIVVIDLFSVCFYWLALLCAKELVGITEAYI
jgi:hypothetical protein